MSFNETPTQSHIRSSNRISDTPSAPTARWLNVVSHLDPRYGGLSAVVPQLGSMIAASKEFSIGIAAFCAPGELYAPPGHSTLNLSYWPTSRSVWLQDRELRERFRAEIAAADGVHIHGLWEQSTAAAAHTARALRRPYVLSAHGMLDPWALSIKKWKKRLYSTLLEKANVNGAACLHALTHAEAKDYRRYGSRQPIAVIPNGVHIPSSTNSDIFLDQFPHLRNKRIILFLGRLHPKKGLDILLESWASLAQSWPEAHLVLAGPDFVGTRSILEKQVLEKGISESTTFPGMLRHEIKWSALMAAECFILPSYSEGLSVSVLEAMGIGLPVIISDQCNLPEVKTLNAGWLIQSKTTAIASTLREFLNNSTVANKVIGARGREFIARHYNWSVISTQMSEVYRWVQGGATPPTVELLTL